MSLRICLLQSELHWENISANLAMLNQKLGQLEPSDLVILPEMFTTGFSMNAAALAEPMHGTTMQWMQQKAESLNTVIVGSLIIKEKGNYYNRLIWMPPNGDMLFYDKKHLFTMAGEEKIYTAGKKKVLIDYKGWKICPFVCYDLRFPVWNRNQQDYDLALYVANWPDKRSYHWRSLLTARAIENQAYVVAVNRVGTDGKGFYYSGHSSVIDPAGEILYQKADVEDLFYTTLKKAHLNQVREQLPFLRDRD